MRVTQLHTHARRSTGPLLAIATCACIAVSGCVSGAASGTAPGSSAAASQPATPGTSAAATPAAVSAGTVHLTGNFCADVATANLSLQQSLNGAVRGTGAARQRLVNVLNATAVTFSALGSEAPGQLKGDLSTLSSFFRSTAGQAAAATSAGQLRRIGIEIAVHASTLTAARQIVSYLNAHCG